MIRTLSELSNRYSVSINAMSSFVTAHRDEIDPDGNFIIKIGRELRFLDEAVVNIDRLRNYDPSISIFEEVQHEEEIKTLKNEINTLKTQLLISQNEAKEAFKALAAANAGALENAEIKARREAEIEGKDDLIREQQRLLSEKNEKIQFLEQKLQEKETQKSGFVLKYRSPYKWHR